MYVSYAITQELSACTDISVGEVMRSERGEGEDGQVEEGREMSEGVHVR